MSENQSVNEKTTQNTEAPELIEIRFSEIIRALRKFWWLCLLLAVIGAGVMFYRSYVRFTPVYSSSVTFTVQTQETRPASMGITSYSFSYNRSTASQLASTFPSIVRSNILQDIICIDLDLPYFPCTLSASSVSGTNMFTVTASGSDPQLTYDVLLSLIKNYPSVAEYVIGSTNLYILNQPEVPAVPANQLAYRGQMLKGALLGLAAGMALIVLYAVFRQTVRSRSDVREKLNQHRIGVLPKVAFKKYNTEIDRSVLITNPMVGDGYLESFRACRNSLVSMLGDARVIMVTSTAPGEGKTTVAVNLALSLTMMNKNVVIVDADLRNPNVCTTLGIGEMASEDAKAKLIRMTKYKVGSDAVLSVLNFNSSRQKQAQWKILNYDHLSRFFQTLRANYDYIIVDTSPIGLTSDPASVAAAADTAVLVIREDTIRVPRIQNSIDILQAADTKLLGCVINGAEIGFGSYGAYGYGKYGYGRYGYGRRYGYGYGYGYSYGYGTEKQSRFRRRRSSDAENMTDDSDR